MDWIGCICILQLTLHTIEPFHTLCYAMQRTRCRTRKCTIQNVYSLLNNDKTTKEQRGYICNLKDTKQDLSPGERKMLVKDHLYETILSPHCSLQSTSSSSRTSLIEETDFHPNLSSPTTASFFTSLH
jgi:hypothetical protein